MIKRRIRVELIYIYLKHSNKSASSFCKRAKISTATLKKILNGEDCKPYVVGRIANALNLRTQQMYEYIIDEDENTD